MDKREFENIMGKPLGLCEQNEMVLFEIAGNSSLIELPVFAQEVSRAAENLMNAMNSYKPVTGDTKPEEKLDNAFAVYFNSLNTMMMYLSSPEVKEAAGKLSSGMRNNLRDFGNSMNMLFRNASERYEIYKDRQKHPDDWLAAQRFRDEAVKSLGNDLQVRKLAFNLRGSLTKTWDAMNKAEDEAREKLALADLEELSKRQKQALLDASNYAADRRNAFELCIGSCNILLDVLSGKKGFEHTASQAYIDIYTTIVKYGQDPLFDQNVLENASTLASFANDFGIKLPDISEIEVVYRPKTPFKKVPIEVTSLFSQKVRETRNLAQRSEEIEGPEEIVTLAHGSEDAVSEVYGNALKYYEQACDNIGGKAALEAAISDFNEQLPQAEKELSAQPLSTAQKKFFEDYKKNIQLLNDMLLKASRGDGSAAWDESTMEAYYALYNINFELRYYAWIPNSLKDHCDLLVAGGRSLPVNEEITAKFSDEVVEKEIGDAQILIEEMSANDAKVLGTRFRKKFAELADEAVFGYVDPDPLAAISQLITSISERLDNPEGLPTTDSNLRKFRNNAALLAQELSKNGYTLKAMAAVNNIAAEINEAIEGAHLTLIYGPGYNTIATLYNIRDEVIFAEAAEELDLSEELAEIDKIPDAELIASFSEAPQVQSEQPAQEQESPKTEEIKPAEEAKPVEESKTEEIKPVEADKQPEAEAKPAGQPKPKANPVPKKSAQELKAEIQKSKEEHPDEWLVADKFSKAAADLLKAEHMLANAFLLHTQSLLNKEQENFGKTEHTAEETEAFNSLINDSRTLLEVLAGRKYFGKAEEDAYISLNRTTEKYRNSDWVNNELIESAAKLASFADGLGIEIPEEQAAIEPKPEEEVRQARPKEAAQPRSEATIKRYNDALMELRRDLAGTKSAVSSDSDQFKTLMTLLDDLDVDRKKHDGMIASESRLNSALTAVAKYANKYLDHCKEDPRPTSERRYQRMAIATRLIELDSSYKNGIPDPKTELVKKAKETVSAIMQNPKMHKAYPGVKAAVDGNLFAQAARKLSMHELSMLPKSSDLKKKLLDMTAKEVKLDKEKKLEQNAIEASGMQKPL